MKTTRVLLRVQSLFIALALLAGPTQAAHAAVTFFVTPAAVSNTYNGTITLQIGGLTNTETVVIQKFLDLNTNSLVDGGDWLMQQFTLTDGQAGMVIGGVTNFNVPGDLNATTGAITATLNFQNGDFMQNLVGKYLYKLSSPVGHFAPITNSFTVTNFPFAQKFTGNVVNITNTGATVSNAIVLVFPPGGHGSPFAGTVANNAGGYSISLPPGSYSPLAFQSNYLGNMSTAPVVTLSSGQTVTTNLIVTNASASGISGRVVDINNSNLGLPGVWLHAKSTQGLLAICFTDTNGNYYFNAPTNSTTWSLNVGDKALSIHGYVAANDGTSNSPGATGVTLAVPKATALMYGSVMDIEGNPLVGLDVNAEDSSGRYSVDGYTDANGNYVVGVLGLGSSDSWSVAANEANQLTNYVFSPYFHWEQTNLNASQAVLQNFTAILATNHITGWLKDNNGNPIAGVEIFASATISGLEYAQEMDTDSTGNYWLNVPNGSWDAQVANWGTGDSLPGNYISPPDQYPVILNNNAVVNFTATNLSLLQVKATSLPDGTNGVGYSQTLEAGGGQPPYSWTNISGALPVGLTLATNGVISGTPTVNGTFNFIVEVTDTLSATVTEPLTLTVIGPPSVVITPTNSVTVPIGSNVTLSVSITGTGPFSYQWQLNGTNLPNGIITTVAGNGTAGFSGDGGAATSAALYEPWGVAVDLTGNLFIADDYYGRIRKVDKNGIITTVAGGKYNGLGNGGAATNAELSAPKAVAVDATGNLFIADTINWLIRKVDTNGIISAVAGNGTNGYSGDGGAATNAELNWPEGVAVDAIGNLFIGDLENRRVRKVSTDGIITTVAGNGGWGYSGDGGAATNAEVASPQGVAVDATGNLFIADLYNNVIRKVDTNGIITTVAGNGYGARYNTGGYSGDGGAATNAELNEPAGVALDAIGSVFIADSYNNVIRKVDTNGIITTVAGNGYGAGSWEGGGYSGDGGTATNAELNNLFGVAVDAIGNLLIADAWNNRIRKVVTPGFISGPTLVLNDLGFGNAGAYDVVVCGPYGSVTSSVVNVTVTLPPVILSAPQMTVSKTNFMFQLSGPAGSNYVLQVSTNLLNWNSVSTSAIPANGTLTLTNTTTGHSRSFYRVYLQ